MNDPSPGGLRLSELSIGVKAKIVRISCERATTCRLLEMGLVPGTPVSVLRVAPLGDPIELSVRGYGLSLRKAEARAISVAPVVD